jgi:hypothetical protein
LLLLSLAAVLKNCRVPFSSSLPVAEEVEEKKNLGDVSPNAMVLLG